MHILVKLAPKLLFFPRQHSNTLRAQGIIIQYSGPQYLEIWANMIDSLLSTFGPRGKFRREENVNFLKRGQC